MSTLTNVKSYIADWEGRFHDVRTTYFDSFTETGTGGHNTLEPLLHKDIGESIQELFNTPGQIQKDFGHFKADLLEYLGDSASLLIESSAAEVGTLTGQVGLSVGAGKFLSEQLKKTTASPSGNEYKRGEWVIIRCGYRHQSKEKIRQEEWASVQMFETVFDAQDENLEPNYIIGFFLQRELNDRLTCFNFQTTKVASYYDNQIEKMPELIKKSLDTNKNYSEARELYIMKDANVDPKLDYKFNIGAEVKYEDKIYNVVDRMTDGRVMLEDRAHTRVKVNPDDVTPYRDNYSARMNDKQRFLSSGEFVWFNDNNQATLGVVSYFIKDDVVVFDCLTGKEHILAQQYIKIVDSKDYMLFVNIPSFSRFRQYAVNADSFLERFVVPDRYKYICTGLFDDHTVDPPNYAPIFGESHIDEATGKPTAGIHLKSDQFVAQEVRDDTVKLLDANPDIGNNWSVAYVAFGVVGLFLVVKALQ